MIKTSTLKEIPRITTLLKKVYILLLFSLFGFSSIQAKTIDFDAVYGNTGDVVGNIQLAITSASAGDVILFKSEYYDLGGATNILIDKPITFQGEVPDSGTFNTAAWGATGIKTTLGNTADFQIRSNNVVFKNISLVRKDQTDGPNTYDILIDARHSDYGAASRSKYTGLKFENVVLAQAGYLFHAGNGVEVSMTNVSFTDFRRIGYWVDRRGRVNNTGKADFTNCIFKLKEETNTFKHSFDFRAISFDAGNTEYPIVLNLNNSTVTNSRFEHTGIALSRCHNMTVEGSTFYDREGIVDQMHIEEFSYNVNVNNNIFDCGGPNANLRTKIFVIDRELQLSRDITIDGNTILNDYNFFISSYSVENITITNNDFTNASAANDNSINLSFYETSVSEPIPSSSRFPSKNVTIKGNKGLDLAKNKNLSLLYLNDNAKDNFDITDYQGRRTFIKIDEPTPIVKEGVYHIINKQTGEKLSVSGNSLTTAQGSADATKWNVIWNSPYTFFIQNVANSNYLETDAGYTENDLLNQGNNGTKKDGDIVPYASNAYSTTNEKPFWAFVPVGSSYEIFAGGNEKQSAIATSGSNVNLVYGKVFNADGTRSPKPLGNNAKWEFVEVSGTTPPITSGQTPFGGTARAIPGAINSVDFDNGGEGVAYHDTSSGNRGSGPRQNTNVDTENRVAAGNVGWIAKNEWLEYTVNVGTSGTYTIDVQVASAGNNGAFHIEFGGTDVTGIQTVSSTGNWGNFVNKTITNVSLAAGEQVMRVYMDGGSFNLGTMNFTATSSNTNNTSISGLTIEAETFNATGGTFNDASAGGPGLGANNNGSAINYVNAGDWVEYVVTIPEAGAYEIEYLIGAPQNGSQIDFSVSGTFFNSTNVPSTGGFDSYQTLKAIQTATFTAGTHLIRLTAGGNTWAWNLDKITLKKVTGTNLKISLDDILLEKEVRLYPNPVQSELHFQNVEGYHSVNIYNLVGVQVLSKKLEANYLNLSNLIDGIYMLELISDTKTEMKKVVVRH